MSKTVKPMMLEEALFEWAARNPEKLLPKLSRNRRTQRDSDKRIAADFVQQFTVSALGEAFRLSDSDRKENEHPGTLAWFIRQLVVIANDTSRTAAGSYAVPVTARVDAMQTLRELHAFGALAHRPIAEGLSPAGRPSGGGNGRALSFDEAFRKRLQAPNRE